MRINEYTKKFSFGLSLNIPINDYEKIINKYSSYISSVYFSLPFGDEFHTRIGVKEEYNQIDAKDKLYKILMLFRKNGIKLEAVINQYHIKLDKLKYVLDKLDNFIKVDSICCLDEYLDIIEQHYNGKMYLISSFNSKVINEKNIHTFSDKYKMLVISKEFMRNPKGIRKVKEAGFATKLLVNNGCSFNCATCRAGQNQCINVFKANLEKNTPEKLYAIQSFFPWELKMLFNKISDSSLIDEIKLSSRPCTYKYLDNCLESYIFNKDCKELIDEDYHNYHLWGRQGNLIPYYKTFDLEKIENIKQKLWNN